MKKAFQDALEAGHIVAALLPDGSPFVVDGVQYYMATEQGFNLSIGRFHAFGDTLRRHDELKLSDELLSVGLDSLEAYFRRCRAQASLDSEQVLDAAQEGLVLISRLKERRLLGATVEQVFEIASIFYFSDEEDPGTIDTDINRKKIQRWLNWDKKKALFTWLLSSPISNYFDSRLLSDPNTLNYLKEVNRTEALDWTRTLLQLRMNGVSNETMSIIESRRETLYGLDGLLLDLLSSTSTTDQPGLETSK